MKIEAKNLQLALTQAAKQLECSVMDLEYEIIQNPKSGFLGFFSKNAIIEVRTKKKSKKDFNKNSSKKSSEPKNEYLEKTRKSSVNFAKEQKNEEQNKAKEEKPYTITNTTSKPKYTVKNDAIFDSFHQESKEESKENIMSEIKLGLERLLKAGEFKIELSELSLQDDNSIYIKLDGEDAALLIGKEGYRYKALSYLLHNWLNPRYKLFIRLEISEFLKNQTQGIEFYLKGIIEKVESTGRAQTKPLDGVLVKIALEKLREYFPNKYVGIRQQNDQKFVIVNDFLKKDE